MLTLPENHMQNMRLRFLAGMKDFHMFTDAKGSYKRAILVVSDVNAIGHYTTSRLYFHKSGSTLNHL